MIEIWELITERKQHKIGKDGGDFLQKPRPDKGCKIKTRNSVTSFHFHNLAPQIYIKIPDSHHPQLDRYRPE
jgi:hypothetical protein